MIKKIFFTLGILIVLLLLGIVFFLLTFDLNHYRNFVASQASNALGRPVIIEGMSTKLSLIPTIKVNGAKILDNDQKEPVLSIPELEAIIELTPLLRGQIVVQKIAIPKANLVWAVENKESKEKQKEPQKVNEPQTQNKGAPKLWIDSINIDALQCKVGKEKPYEFTLGKITLNQLSKFSFDVSYLKNTFTVNGNFGSILELVNKKQNLPVDLTVSQDKAKLRINGKIGDVINLKKMNFQITADIPNLENFLKKWNVKSDKIPSSLVTLKTTFEGDLTKANLQKISFKIGKTDVTFDAQGTLETLAKNPTASLTGTLLLKEGTVSKLWGIKPFELTTKIGADKKVITFSEMQLNAGKSDGHGQIQIKLDQKPFFIQGQLDSTYFDIYDLIETNSKNVPTKGSASNSKKRFLSTEKLPFDLLKQIDADIRLNIAHLRFSKEIMDYADVKTVISLEKGVLNMPSQIGIFGGNVQNQLSIQSDKKNVSLETKASGIQLNKIKPLKDDIQNASVYLTLSLKGNGNSLHDLASTAQGYVTAELTEGQIINKWFNSLPATLDLLKRGNVLAFSTQDQKTELICGALNVPIKNGVATSQNQIALETNTLNFVVSGKIDLKNETVDLAMVPSVGQTRGLANEVLNVVKSVGLYGSWSEIKTKVDTTEALEGILNMAASKLTGKTSEKQNMSPKALCQKVLGRSLTQKTKGVQKVQPKTEQKSVNTSTKAQPNLKEQLIQSLSQALTDQIAPEKK